MRADERRASAERLSKVYSKMIKKVIDKVLLDLDSDTGQELADKFGREFAKWVQATPAKRNKLLEEMREDILAWLRKINLSI